ncbi:MAG: hypothetical protein MR387_00970 [Phocaeicola plebeius]|nr:hypothetical protein [Phocaeicola plebeius]
MNETKKTDLKSYEAPETKRTQVELEDGICTGVVSSGETATLKQESAQIEVKEYTSIDNDVTFN